MEGKTEAPDFERDTLILRFHEEIPSTNQAITQLVTRLMALAQEMECAPGELDKVELALQEALNNAVLHGHKGDPNKKIAVTCYCQATKGILVRVSDMGPGFDPAQVPDPTAATDVYSSHGRGIFLIRQLMDEVEFKDRGRTVIMKKEVRKEE